MTKDEIAAASESNRSSAFLYREALRNEWIDHTMNVRNSGQWYVPVLSADEYRNTPTLLREAQLRAYLCESLATALDHPDPVIALRAYGQATAYAGRLEGMGTTPGSRHCDALLEARNRLESMLRTSTTVAECNPSFMCGYHGTGGPSIASCSTDSYTGFGCHAYNPNPRVSK